MKGFRKRRPMNPRFEDVGFPSPVALRMVTLDETDRYHRKKSLINKTILKHTDSHEIIHGEHAVKKQTPTYLHRHTDDIDIYTGTPKADAVEVEKALDKVSGSDDFYVVPGIHPNTFKVVAKATGRNVADYTLLEEKIPYKTIGGKKYASLDYLLRKARGNIRNPFVSFRSSKDQDTMNRIIIAKKKKKNRGGR